MRSESGKETFCRRHWGVIKDGVKLSGGDQVLRTSTLIQDSSERGEEQGDLRGESDGSPPPQDSLPGDGEARNDFWSISGNYIYRHHVDSRVKLYVPREESFPVALRYIDVARTASTTLDVLLKSHRRKQRPIRFVDRVHTIHNTEWKNLQTDVHGPGAADEETNDIQARSPVAKDVEKSVRCSATKRKTKLVDRETEARQCKKVERYLFHRSGRWRWRKLEVPMPAACLAEPDAKSTGKPVAFWIIVRQNTHASLKPTNLRESVRKELYIKVMKTTLQEQESIHWTTSILCANLFQCLKQWKHQVRKRHWTKNEKTWKYWHGNWWKSETKRWSLKQGKKDQQYILRRK